MLLTLLLVGGCAGAPEASRSLRFDAASKSAIVVIGTSVTREQDEEVRSGRSLSTFWQEYDVATRRLVPGGKTFSTTVAASAFSAKPAYLTPTVAVLEIEPGDYALVGAGFPHLMTTFMAAKPGPQDERGRGQSWHFTVDPRMHIDPAAPVDPRHHFLFSVAPGEIVYIGHYEFLKPPYADTLVSINHYQDEAAARAALADYPGISGLMVTYDPARPPQQVSR
ncbi:MAG TPA: hypothetical protein VKP12_07755 [Kiloniellaceae bacterium]|nr:hypothetical protein [Kiloniellaceae bacterium]